MGTLLEIILLILIISTIGLIVGYIVGALTCKNKKSKVFIKKGRICEKNAKITEDQEDLLKNEAKELIEASNQDSLNIENNENKNKIELIKKDSKNDIKSQINSLPAPKDGKADELCKIKGIGNVIESKLNELGIYHFEQIAAWGEKEIALIDEHLAFKGRIVREEWVEQAKILANGEETEFSKRVQKGEVASSKIDK